MPWRENEGKANKVKGSTPEGGDIGTGPCPDEQQGAAYIGTLTCLLSCLEFFQFFIFGSPMIIQIKTLIL